MSQMILQHLLLESKIPSDYDIDIDSFSYGGETIPVYWPRGVVPEVSGATDIYSFKIFDGSDLE